MAALSRELHVPLCGCVAPQIFHEEAKESKITEYTTIGTDSALSAVAHLGADKRTGNGKSSPVTWKNFME